MDDDLVKRLRDYDKHNNRGKYAVICREAADAIERLSARIAALESGQPVEVRSVIYQLQRISPAHIRNNEVVLTASAQEAVKQPDDLQHSTPEPKPEGYYAQEDKT